MAKGVKLTKIASWDVSWIIISLAERVKKNIKTIHVPSSQVSGKKQSTQPLPGRNKACPASVSHTISYVWDSMEWRGLGGGIFEFK